MEGGFTNKGLLGSSSDIMPGITYANDGDDPRLVGICQEMKSFFLPEWLAGRELNYCNDQLLLVKMGTEG